MIVDSDTIADIQLEGVMLFSVFVLVCCGLDVIAIQVFIYILLELKIIYAHGFLGYKTANAWCVLIFFPDVCRWLTCSRFVVDWANFALFAVAYLCRFRALQQASDLNKAEGFPPTDQIYISYDDPAFWIMMWKNIFAFNCIITWVKMLKHLGHIPVMTHIIKVMAHCLPGVLNFLFVFIFIFVGSSMAHLLAYGDSTYRFKDLPMSMYRCNIIVRFSEIFIDFCRGANACLTAACIAACSVTLTLWKCSWGEKSSSLSQYLLFTVCGSNRIIGPAFFIIWTLIGLVVLFNMYVLLDQTVALAVSCI